MLPEGSIFMADVERPEKPKKAQWEVRVAFMKAAWRRSGEELREGARGRVQFYARSMVMAGLMDEVDVITQDMRTGAETSRERMGIVPLDSKRYNQGDSTDCVDFAGRAFLGRQIGRANGAAVDDIIKYIDASEGWYGNNDGRVFDAWGRRIEEVGEECTKSAVA